MTEVGIRAWKQNASAVVAQAAAGERLTITDRGRPDRVLQARLVLDAVTILEVTTAMFSEAGRLDPTLPRWPRATTSTPWSPTTIGWPPPPSTTD